MKDDMISRAAAIDAIVSVTAFPDAEYIKNLCQNPANSEDWLGGVCDAINAVEDVNAVDAAPVVRCRDCKYGKLCFDADGHGLIQCTNTNYPAANVETWPLELDWYCAGGERRESE